MSHRKSDKISIILNKKEDRFTQIKDIKNRNNQILKILI